MGWLDDLESGDLGVQGWSGTDFSCAGEETSVGMFGGAPRGTVLGTLRRVGKKDDAIKEFAKKEKKEKKLELFMG